MNHKILVGLIGLLMLLACNQEKQAPEPSSIKTETQTKSLASAIDLRSLSPESSNIQYANVIKETAARNQNHYDYFYNGAGVAIADFDNDGLSDIFFCGNDSRNGIYKNLGGLKFEDRTKSALPESNRWALGVSVVDINSDGFLDIYVCNSGPDRQAAKLKNELFLNNGDFSFTESAKKYGVDVGGHSVQAEFFDYDGDGDLDLWVNNHGNVLEINGLIPQVKPTDGSNAIAYLNKLKHRAISDAKIRLLRNDGDKFVDASSQAGVSSIAYGLGLSIADLNDDGHLDVYVANDYWIPDYYFINNGKGRFTTSTDRINHSSFYSMGIDVADYNNDALLDICVVDMTPKDHFRNKTLMESMDSERFNSLTFDHKFRRQYMFNAFQVGVGNGHFSEIANALDVSLTDWSWAPLFFDMDNDGFNDLYVTNGYLRDTKNQDFRRKTEKLKETKKLSDEEAFNNLLTVESVPVANAIFQNSATYRYKNVTKEASNLGATFSNGAAYGDLDNDGDLDLVISNLNAKATLLVNQSKAGNYLRIKLTSDKPESVRHAKVMAYAGGQLVRRDNSFVRGYLSTVEPIIHMGLGSAAQVDKLIITWRNGEETILNNLKTNQLLTLDYDQLKRSTPTAKSQKRIFEDMSQFMVQQNIVHKEISYNDFGKEVLLPQKYSSLGPAMAIGDINKDGFGDFYVGGSMGNQGRLMMMQQKGNKEVSSHVFAHDAAFEDLGAVFFDANGDQYPDLYVASGGGGEIKSDKLLQDRLYVNRGNGSFVRNIKALPKITSSTKKVLAFDFDGDKDLDLFVGGRNVPGQYPDKALSYLLENENGNFKNVIGKRFSSDLPNMITDAVVDDLNKDGHLDLIITGEWSEPVVFHGNGKGDFKKVEIPALEGKRGWWYSVAKGDFNKDGRTDFVFGNLGMNNKFHASGTNPLDVLYDDFDNNGSQDIVLTKNYKGKRVPVRGKECSSEQMPMLNDKFTTYSDFASASVQEILGNKSSSCDKLTATYFQSVVMMSKGSSYTVEALPFEAQWSPILDSEVIDLNKDGYDDLILAGNIFETEPETPSYDAGKGLILINDKAGNFNVDIDITKSGLNLNKNTKAIGILRRSTEDFAILAANNNSHAQLFIYNR